MTRLVAAGLATCLLLCLSACGEDPSPGASGGWTPSEDPVDRTGLVYETGGVVHLADGSTIDTGAEVQGWLLAGDGVYFVPESDDLTGELWLATPEGSGPTGAEAEARSLVASPDGRYLAFIDLTTGEQDSYGTPVATAVVVDLTEGEEVVRSAEGMGDPDSDGDLFDLYEDASGPEILAVTEDAAYVASPGGYLEYSLPSGEATMLPDDTSAMDQRWYDADGSVTSPSGDWLVRDPLDGQPELVPTGGGPAVPLRSDAERVSVAGWLDDQTALGLGYGSPDDPPGSDQQDPVLLRCPVADGRCVPIPGTEDGATLPLGGLDLG